MLQGIEKAAESLEKFADPETPSEVLPSPSIPGMENPRRGLIGAGVGGLGLGSLGALAGGLGWGVPAAGLGALAAIPYHYLVRDDEEKKKHGLLGDIMRGGALGGLTGGLGGAIAGGVPAALAGMVGGGALGMSEDRRNKWMKHVSPAAGATPL